MNNSCICQHPSAPGIYPDNKACRKVNYATSAKQAEEIIIGNNMPEMTSDMIFSSIADVWFSSVVPTISFNTMKEYRTQLYKHLIPAIGQYRLAELKPYHLQSLINRLMAEGYSKSTLHEIRGVAMLIMSFARDNDFVSRNVFERVKVPAMAPTTVRRPLTMDEISLVKRSYMGHRMGLMSMIMLLCGLRRSEVLALKWADIDLSNKYINVNKGLCFDGNKSVVKTPKSSASVRLVPIPDVLQHILMEAQTDANSEVVVPSRQGCYMTQIAFKRAWESYLHYLNLEAGGRDASRSRPKVQVIDNITPHMFRHTYATLLYDAGVDIKSAQKFMGHADAAVTFDIYTHLSKEQEHRAMQAFNTHIAE